MKNFRDGKKFLGGKDKFIEGVKNEVAPKKKKKKKSSEKISGNKGKKGQLRTIKGNFFN